MTGDNVDAEEERRALRCSRLHLRSLYLRSAVPTVPRKSSCGLRLS